MEGDVPESVLERLSEVVGLETGLCFPRERWADLRRALCAAAADLGYKGGAMECAQRIVERSTLTKQQLDSLVDHLTVGETYFFRDRRHFDFLTEQIVPELLRRDPGWRMRVWCAGCCTGEEAYSLAIALRRAMPHLEQRQVTVMGTDINARFLRRAEVGVYGQWSFRDAPDWLKPTWFTALPDGQFQVLPEIKRLVRFARLNLADDVYLPLMDDGQPVDVIFCRNVLMYFGGEQARKVVEKMHQVQREGGWLFVGSSELLHLSSAPYAMINAPKLILFRKTSRPPARALFHPPAPPVIAKYVPLPTPAIPVATVDRNIPSPDSTRRAEQLYSDGYYEEAACLLTASLESTPPHDPKRLVLLARCLADQGRLVEALRRCDQAVDADACNVTAHYLRATVLLEQGKVEEAAGCLRRVLFLDPHFALAHVALGNLAHDRKDTAGARRHFHHAMEILRPFRPGDVLVNSEGITAGQLMDMVQTLVREEVTQ